MNSPAEVSIGVVAHHGCTALETVRVHVDGMGPSLHDHFPNKQAFSLP